MVLTILFFMISSKICFLVLVNVRIRIFLGDMGDDLRFALSFHRFQVFSYAADGRPIPQVPV
jgi:hypothetical protein